MGNKNVYTDYELNLILDEQLDVLDLDYQYEQFRTLEDAKESLAHHFWSQRIAKNGMTYGQIQQLNDLELTLSK
jgi:hypothetical protein